eukprot:m.769242 g.769242  ORF g.769242 m.769242 type:complete len:256 (-) comp23235_c0_seq11:4446-5213(-)
MLPGPDLSCPIACPICQWYAGSHLHNTIVWSGDISSDWATLRRELVAGLNFQLTYPYWNTDTGGFSGGDWETMGELVVRWFQVSIFTSIVRLHGSRTPAEPSWVPLSRPCDPTDASGGPIEPWVYGPANYSVLQHIKEALQIRKSLLPYMRKQLTTLVNHGTPVMRPLWFDFPRCSRAENVTDQFMFGPDYMVAPVLEPNVTERLVLFPGDGGVRYVHHFTGKEYMGGSSTLVPVSGLGDYPLFQIQRTHGDDRT